MGLGQVLTKSNILSGWSLSYDPQPEPQPQVNQISNFEQVPGKSLDLTSHPIVNTFHPEPPKAVYYWEKKKLGQISDLKFHQT